MESMFFSIGVVFTLIGIPLFFQKIKRNSLYGFRTAKTLSDDKYWFPVNRVAGKWFIITGVAINFFYGLLNGLLPNKMHLFWAMIFVVIIAVALPVAASYRLLKKIS